MTASIKEREDRIVTVRLRRRPNLSEENKEEQLNQLKETLEAKEEQNRARERQVERTKAVSYLTGTH